MGPHYNHNSQPAGNTPFSPPRTAVNKVPGIISKSYLVVFPSEVEGPETAVGLRSLFLT